VDQLAVIGQLDKIATIVRRGGLQRLTRLGRNVVKSLLREGVTANFENLFISAPVELRGFLSRVRAGRFEPFMSRLYKESLTMNSIVLDIGACFGYYTLLAAQLGAKVYAFEPDLEVFHYLAANIHKNNFDESVVAISKAVSDKAGAMSFFVHEDDRTQNSLFDDAEHRRIVRQVETLSLDEFLPEGLPVDVIKMDIEGAELHALAGMEKTLSYPCKTTLFVECNPVSLSLGGSSPGTLLRRLENLGFRVWIISEEEGRLVPAGGQLETLKKYVNLYCVQS
jgi:FkbM family methyltransferase